MCQEKTTQSLVTHFIAQIVDSRLCKKSPEYNSNMQHPSTAFNPLQRDNIMNMAIDSFEFRFPDINYYRSNNNEHSQRNEKQKGIMTRRHETSHRGLAKATIRDIVIHLLHNRKVRLTTTRRRQAITIAYINPNRKPVFQKVCKSEIWMVPDLIIKTTYCTHPIVMYTFERAPQKIQFIWLVQGGFGAPCDNPNEALRSAFAIHGIDLGEKGDHSLSATLSAGLTTPVMRGLIEGLFFNRHLDDTTTVNVHDIVDNDECDRCYHPSDIPNEEELRNLELCWASIKQMKKLERSRKRTSFTCTEPEILDSESDSLKRMRPTPEKRTPIHQEMQYRPFIPSRANPLPIPMNDTDEFSGDANDILRLLEDEQFPKNEPYFE